MALIAGMGDLKIEQGSTWRQPVYFPASVDLSVTGLDAELTISKCTEEQIKLNTGNGKIVIDSVNNKIDCYLNHEETKRFTKDGTWKLELIYPATESAPEERFKYGTGQIILKPDITEI